MVEVVDVENVLGGGVEVALSLKGVAAYLFETGGTEVDLTYLE